MILIPENKKDLLQIIKEKQNEWIVVRNKKEYLIEYNKLSIKLKNAFAGKLFNNNLTSKEEKILNTFKIKYLILGMQKL